MCLASSGTIVAIATEGEEALASEVPGDDLWLRAQVDFGGVRQWVSLACLPQARVGDQVLVHVGMALSLVEETP